MKMFPRLWIALAAALSASPAAAERVKSADGKLSIEAPAGWRDARDLAPGRPLLAIMDPDEPTRRPMMIVDADPSGRMRGLKKGPKQLAELAHAEFGLRLKTTKPEPSRIVKGAWGFTAGDVRHLYMTHGDRLLRVVCPAKNAAACEKAAGTLK